MSAEYSEHTVGERVTDKERCIFFGLDILNLPGYIHFYFQNKWRLGLKWDVCHTLLKRESLKSSKKPSIEVWGDFSRKSSNLRSLRDVLIRAFPEVISVVNFLTFQQ